MDPQLAAFISKYLWAPFAAVAAWVWKDLKNAKDDVDSLKTEVAILKVNSVSEDKVRNIIHEQIQPLHQSIREVKDSVKENSNQAKEIYDLINKINIELARQGQADKGN